MAATRRTSTSRLVATLVLAGAAVACGGPISNATPEPTPVAIPSPTAALLTQDDAVLIARAAAPTAFRAGDVLGAKLVAYGDLGPGDPDAPLASPREPVWVIDLGDPPPASHVTVVIDAYDGRTIWTATWST